MPHIDKLKIAERSLPMLRRDFTKQSHCCLCKDSGHQLPTGKATILLHPDAGEIAAGRTCGERYGIKPSFPLPDLTRAVLEDTQESTGKSDLTATPQPSPADGRNKVLEYLLLRQSRLPDLGIKGTYWKELAPALEAYRAGQPTDEALRPVARTMATHDARQSNLSYDNLQTLYAAVYWIDRCKEKKPRHIFLRKIDSILQQDLRLSDARIDVLNEIIHECFTESAPQLKAFKSPIAAIRPTRTNGPASPSRNPK